MDSENQPNSRLDAIATRWTLLREAHALSNASSVEARQALVLRYLPAIRRYVGAITRQDDLAQDMTQEVVVRLMSGGFAGADPHRGRFRDLLKTSIRNLIRNQWTREQRRRTTSLEVDDLADNDSAADEAWDESWRLSVLDLAWNALQQHERNAPDHRGLYASAIACRAPGRIVRRAGQSAFDTRGKSRSARRISTETPPGATSIRRSADR